MAAENPLSDPSLRDLAWVGYHPRASTPTFALAVVASVLVLVGRWYLEDLSEFADRVGALVVFALAWAVWPGLLLASLYRTVTYTYRLTDRALLADFGFFFNPVTPVELADATAVAIGGGWLTRWLGVGWVEMRTKEKSLRLTGVRHPSVFAEKIRVAIASCRKC